MPSWKATVIVALIECDNTGGLAKEIDLLKDLHALAFNKLPGNLGRLLSRQSSITSLAPVKLREIVLQIFDSPCKTTDVVANTVVETRIETICVETICVRHKLLQRIVEDSALFPADLLISNSLA